MKEKNEFGKHQAAKKYYDAGQDLALRGRYEEAITAFNKSIELDPTSSLVAYQQKGKILQDLRRYDEAVAMYDQSLLFEKLSIYQTQTMMLSKVGIYIEQRKWDEAEAILKDQRLGEVWEESRSLQRVLLAKCAYGKGEYARALKYCDEAIKLDNDMLEKTKSALQEGRFNSSNSDTQSLARTLSQNYQEQESIGREISDAISAQDQLSRSRQYVAQNAATIDRNMNEPVLNAIIDSHIPGVSSKEQAARWARTHIHEAASIANSVMPVDNIALESGRYLSGISADVKNIPMRSEQHLKDEYQMHTSKIEASADKINNKQEVAYQDVETRLNNNLSSSEKENYNNLNNTAQLVEQKGKKIEDKYEDTSDSTVKRTLDEMGKNSRPIL